MTTVPREPIEQERVIVQKIKDACQALIKEAGETPQTLAPKLRLMDIGVEILFARTWDLTVAWRVASALGLKLDVVISHLGTSEK